MDQIVSDNILASSFLFIWILTLAWYQYRNTTFDAGSTVIAFYIVYAVFSIVTINDFYFSEYFLPLTLFPYIYLYIMMMIALAPAVHHHLYPPKTIVSPNTRILKLTGILIVCCAFIQIPDIITNFQSGIVKLFLDSDAGKDAYDSHMEDAGDAGSAITNLPSVIYNSLFDLSIFIFFFFLTLKKKNKKLIMALGASIFIGTLIPIMNGLRGGVIISIQTIICGYMLFRRYLSKQINRIANIVGISTIILLSLPIIAISISRFSQRNYGVMGAIYWYVGQGSLYFNNYGLDAGGIRYGDRTLNLVKRVIDPENTPKNYIERRYKYPSLEIDDYYYTTFVGDFTIDFGPITAFILFVLFFSWLLIEVRGHDNKIELHQMLLLYFSLCISIQGGMSLFYYSDTSNLRIITCFMLYTYLRYHEALLKKFPLLPNKRP